MHRGDAGDEGCPGRNLPAPVGGSDRTQKGVKDGEGGNNKDFDRHMPWHGFVSNVEYSVMRYNHNRYSKELHQKSNWAVSVLDSEDAKDERPDNKDVIDQTDARGAVQTDRCHQG